MHNGDVDTEFFPVQQPKHIIDIAAIMLTLRDELDNSYIQRWADDKELQALWKSVKLQIQIKLS